MVLARHMGGVFFCVGHFIEAWLQLTLTVVLRVEVSSSRHVQDYGESVDAIDRAIIVLQKCTYSTGATVAAWSR